MQIKVKKQTFEKVEIPIPSFWIKDNISMAVFEKEHILSYSFSSWSTISLYPNSIFSGIDGFTPCSKEEFMNVYQEAVSKQNKSISQLIKESK